MTERKDSEIKTGKTSYSMPLAIIIAGAMLSWAIAYRFSPPDNRSLPVYDNENTGFGTETISPLEQAVVPREGVILPVKWNDLGLKLATNGVIDIAKLEALYGDRGGLPDELKRMLLYDKDENIKINGENAAYLLNLFWALGLANANPILADDMMDKRYGGPQYFASTAGWTIARGQGMDHYGRHEFISLTPQQQTLVDRMSRGIYRPCCDNSTHFPDCNHGMAMLGLLELMASQGASEEEMWQAALAVNSYWFPSAYITIASYMKQKEVEWQDVNPQEILGINYSSSSGFARISAQMTPSSGSGSDNGCDLGNSVVNAGAAPKQVGCGV